MTSKSLANQNFSNTAPLMDLLTEENPFMAALEPADLEDLANATAEELDLMADQAIAYQLSRLFDRPPSAQHDPHQHTRPHVQARTIIALVTARLTGRSQTAVLKQPDTCNYATYHLRWKKDPLFADVMEQVEKIARRYRDTQASAAVRNAATKLAYAAPEAADALVELVQQQHDQRLRRQAAVSILDRAGLETAQKSTSARPSPEGLDAALQKVYGHLPADTEPDPQS